MMMGRLLVSLAAVLGVMWVIARRMRRGGARSKNTRVIEILDRAALTRSASVAVVRVGDQALVLGIADAQVSVLGETDLAAAQVAQAAAAGPKVKRPARASHRGAQVPAPVAAALTNRIRETAAQARPADQPAPVASTAGPLAGSALSPQTWKQTIESLRDLTSRT